MRRVQRMSIALLFFIFAVSALALSIFKPFYNWQMIDCIASAVSIEETDIKTPQSFTCDRLQQSIPGASYENLTVTVNNSTQFRQAQSAENRRMEELL